MEHSDQSKKILRLDLLGAAFGAALFLWLPLYLYNGYVGLINGKASMLYLLTLAFGLCILAALVQKRPLGLAKRLRGGGIGWLAAMCVCALVSTLVTAQDPKVAFLGLAGRANGLLMLLVCTAAVVLLRLTVTQNGMQAILKTFLRTAAVAAVIGWLNYFWIDPLDCFYSLRSDMKPLFLSTVGNTNFFGAYIAMAAAAALWGLMRCRTKRELCRCRVLAVLLISALFPASSDGAWIAFYVAAALILCSRESTGKSAARVMFVGALSLLAGAAAGTLAKFVPVHHTMNNLSAPAKSPVLALLLAVLLVGAAWWLQQYKGVTSKLFRIVFLLAALAAAMLIVLANFTSIPLGKLGELLTFGPRWGSNRGYVWGVLFNHYFEFFDFEQKLIGVGPDGVNAIINPRYTDYIQALNRGTFDSAHNVYLQQLLCGGILGLLCWCGFWVNRLCKAFRSGSIWAPVLVVYCVQAFFSIDMPCILPLAFAAAAMTGAAEQNDNLNECRVLGWGILAGIGVSLLVPWIKL